jgi:hypothetical protein
MESLQGRFHQTLVLADIIGEFTIGATTILMTVAKIPATISTLQELMKPSVVRLGLLFPAVFILCEHNALLFYTIIDWTSLSTRYLIVPSLLMATVWLLQL